MTHDEYLWAWGAYLSGACVFLALFWYWTRKIAWQEPRHMLRLIMAVAVLVPWYTDAQYDFLSPAWMVAAADMLMEGPDAFWRAGLVLIAAEVVALILSTLAFLVLWWRARSKSAT